MGYLTETDVSDYGINCVRDWHIAFQQPVAAYPNLGPNSADRMRTRAAWMSEELAEFVEAVNNDDLVEAFDALLDLQYLLYGTVLELGLARYWRAGFMEVHGSNCTKLDSYGEPILREDGKVQKGTLFMPPNLGAVLAGQSPYFDNAPSSAPKTLARIGQEQFFDTMITFVSLRARDFYNDELKRADAARLSDAEPSKRVTGTSSSFTFDTTRSSNV